MFLEIALFDKTLKVIMYFTYDFWRVSKSLSDPKLSSVSGYDNFEIANAAGADITEAAIRWLAGTCYKNVKQKSTTKKL